MRRSAGSLLAACCLAPTLVTIFAGSASAASFTLGDIVVEQVGATGSTTALSGTSVPVFLDEFSTTGGTAVQSLALPTTASGSNLALTDSGSAGSDGMITNSADGRYLFTTGYNAPAGTASVTGTASSATARVIARVDATGAISTSTSTAAFSGNNIRSATSLDGSTILSAGTSSASTFPSGVQSEAFGATASQNYSAGTENLRVVHVFGGLTFVSGAAASAPGGINLVNPPSGSTAGSLTAVPGIAGGSSTSTYGFSMLRTGTGPTYLSTGLDTIYLADSSAGITKYVWSGTTFVSSGNVATPASGLAARLETVGSATLPVLYFASGTTLYRLVDAASSGTLSGTPATLATAATNTAYRGVAFAPPTAASIAPITAPTSLPEAPYAVLLPLIGLSAVGVLHVRRSSRRAARSTD